MWYLFESDDGWCVVHDKNVLQAGTSSTKVEVGATCKYFYQGKEYMGNVLMKDEFHERVNEELSRLKKKPKEAKRAEESEQLPPKRKIQPVSFYGKNADISFQKPLKKKKDERPKMTEEEKKRNRILDLNKREAERRANHDLLAKATSSTKSTSRTKTDNDPEWNPEIDDQSVDSDIGDLIAHTMKVKENRNKLVSCLKDGSSTFETVSPSPTKEELKQQNQMLLVKLQLAYDESTKKEAQSKKASRIDTNFDLDDFTTNASTKKAEALSKKASQIDTNFDFDDYNNGDGELDPGKQLNSWDANVNDSTDELKDISQDGDKVKELNKGGDSKQKFDSERDDSIRNNDSEVDLCDTSTDANERLEYQLYGNRNDTTLICRKVYCKTSVLTKALSNANNVVQLARRMMHGVFIPSKLANCTVTGQTWHAGGAEKRKEEKDPLHQEALRAIVDFCNGVAKKRKWALKKFEKVKAPFSIRLNEIKKLCKNGKLPD